MNRHSLRNLAIGSVVGGGFALVVLLCLGVALVRSIEPISQAPQKVSLAATQPAMPVAAGTAASEAVLSPTGASTSTGTLPSTASPASADTLLPSESPVQSPVSTDILPPTASPVPSDTLPPAATPDPSSTATDTLSITDTVSPSPTPSDTPSPDSTPAPVAIRGTTGYMTANGERHVVGEVTNGASGSIWFVKVEGTFYDVAGQVVVTDSAYTMLDVIGAGEAAPFDLALLEPSPSIDHYELQLEYATTDSPPLRVEVVSHQGSVSDTGSYHVVGEVRNQNAVAVNFVKVVVTLYNAQNQVIRTDFSNTALDVLSPGQTASFDVALLDPPADMDHYQVKAQAYP